ncbi:MAG: aminotransferase class III-fold pyridoxal phosphate-dependent enzyme [Kiritimatiellae bacterium]|nr:aminotransferase class III-fold pyridoxal phosphate-dependent enzyme [Kiritimatiellia bacterium]
MPTVSEAWTARARAVMPWGSSTCSKSPRFPPDEPGVIVKGKGCRVWDADGREFIDFRNALGPITLGYCFPAVNAAIRAQLRNGIVFGHPAPLECEVAEMICEAVPCAEQARFLKTGGEANAACIRIARAVTGREHVIHIGYNGWLNGLAPGARALPGRRAAAAAGVPVALSALHHAVNWNDTETMDRFFSEHTGNIAAVIVAADYPDMAQGKTFYPYLREITTRDGAVLIFDEIVTGFRIALAGAQEYFGVTPDMAVFAKGVANGMPLAVYAGKREIMAACEPGGAVISSTYGGETLSLAAAKATIGVYRTRKVVDHIWTQSMRVWTGLNTLLDARGLPVRLKGLWPCAAFVFAPGAPADLEERFFRAAYRNGVSLYGVSYVTFSHRRRDIDEALERMDRALRRL